MIGSAAASVVRSVERSRLIVSETPYSGLLGQPSSTGLAGQHAANRNRLLSTQAVRKLPCSICS
jgi:hypothetical protein